MKADRLGISAQREPTKKLTQQFGNTKQPGGKVPVTDGLRSRFKTAEGN